MDGEEDCKEKPEDGVFVNGLFLEGAKWDYEAHALAESDPKALYVQAPNMWLKPAKISDLKVGLLRCVVT